MPHPYVTRLFTDDVKAVQDEYGVREDAQRLADYNIAHDVMADRERRFIEARDSFYMATVNSDGWPYIQHRGGPKGFMKVIDEKTLAFADFSGNDQYITVGNLRGNTRVSLFFMDYINKRRLKMIGHCTVVTEKENLMQVAALEPEESYGYAAHRAFIITIDSFDWNCPQHITQRFTEEDVEAMMAEANTTQMLPTAEDARILKGTGMPAEVVAIIKRADNITEFSLKPKEGGAVVHQAGSHIKLMVRNHDNEIKVNSYSLINGPDETDAFRIAVLKEEAGDGGSHFMHSAPRVGDILYVQSPQNDFPLEEDIRHSLLIAGGIGITPIFSMAQALHKKGASFDLHYTARTVDAMAYKEALLDLAGQRAHFYESQSAENPRKIDLQTLLNTPEEGVHIYVCGPKKLIDAVIEVAHKAGWPKNQVHFELFGNPDAKSRHDTAMEVVLQKSSKTIEVAPDQTLLDALLDAGIKVGFNCRRGECGTCRVPVLEGDIDHRDIVLDRDEKSAGQTMCACVSRARQGVLVLDL